MFRLFELFKRKEEKTESSCVSMPIIAKVKVKDSMIIKHIRGDQVIAERYCDKITTIGLVELAKLFGGAGTAMTYLALGTGTTPAAAGDTALEAEITTSGLERTSVTPTYDGSSAILTHTWTKTGADTIAVTEEGELNAASGGILAAHQVFAALNVTAPDEIKVTHGNVFAEG